MTPKQHAHASRVLWYAKPRDWDCSYDEIAEATGLTYKQVNATITRMGWGGRIGMRRRKEKISRERVAKMSRTQGYRFDENALDLVDLIGQG
jgi:hypothetical protein